ncbi:hypothetical protein [uncultured Vibrio sp.]|uniref:hypothetical protein n=1 Tax=uncultured Vibrio sp. TaxID=114054 RepID=UPI00260B8F0E|nr:hypothetical protein [uncultured Vibrio sp.]
MNNKLTDITHGFEYSIEKIFAGLSPHARQINLEFASTQASHLRGIIDKLDVHSRGRYPFASYKESVTHASDILCEYFVKKLEGQERSHSMNDLKVFVDYIELVITTILRDSQPQPSVTLI